MAQVKTVDRTPAYKRIAAGIRERIERGELVPGDLIESERDLGRTHGVSLMTARHALMELEREGAVHRRRGSGTFVSPPRIHFNRLVSFSEQMSSRGFTPRSKVLSAQIVEHNDAIAAKLSLSEGTPLVRIQRLRLGNGEPFAVETVYLDSTRFSGLLDEGMDRRSLFQTLADKFGIEISYADEEVDATQADSRVAALLLVSLRAPILRISQLLYSKDAQPTCYSMALYRSDRYSVSLRRFR
jgi:GntR family transcriptional regulator